jgi:hypothetical protein
MAPYPTAGCLIDCSPLCAELAAVFIRYTMLGYEPPLLRDIAVNESDQGRVADSGAIRSGLVPQLKHKVVYRRFPRGLTLEAFAVTGSPVVL